MHLLVGGGCRSRHKKAAVLDLLKTLVLGIDEETEPTGRGRFWCTSSRSRRDQLRVLTGTTRTDSACASISACALSRTGEPDDGYAEEAACHRQNHAGGAPTWHFGGVGQLRPGSNKPIAITAPAPRTSDARVIFHSASDSISEDARTVGCIYLHSGTMPAPPTSASARSASTSTVTFVRSEIVGRDLGALRQGPEAPSAERSEDRDHERDGVAAGPNRSEISHATPASRPSSCKRQLRRAPERRVRPIRSDRSDSR